MYSYRCFLYFNFIFFNLYLFFLLWIVVLVIVVELFFSVGYTGVMDLSMEDLEKTVSLAHLTVKEEKKEMYLSQMQSILDQVDTIDALDLADVKPTETVVEQGQFLREDIPVKPDDLHLEKNAPLWEEQAFRVPRILKR
ncbi:Asp-tRNA(Asn)/Glu-tRNA(Gln) amidotransferase GatCAB subunit C [Candidatus Marinamargulisbacteria bacterium SCGC AG-343-D04]|nr:Asp-tRNA(Asn)/Glu-tRNA(Gln) amidotransferase GatCAB subunit C [Candidatus Marinamargulisbacteria bacterium SCGC AG-343-D04]